MMMTVSWTFVPVSSAAEKGIMWLLSVNVWPLSMASHTLRFTAQVSLSQLWPTRDVCDFSTAWGRRWPSDQMITPPIAILFHNPSPSRCWQRQCWWRFLTTLDDQRPRRPLTKAHCRKGRGGVLGISNPWYTLTVKGLHMLTLYKNCRAATNHN